MSREHWARRHDDQSGSIEPLPDGQPGRPLIRAPPCVVASQYENSANAT